MVSDSPLLAVERRIHAVEQGSETLPAPTASATARALSEALAAVELDDHVGALRDYAGQRDGVTLTQDDRILILAMSDGEVLIELDDDQRIARLAFSMNAHDLPRPRFWSRLFGRP